MGQSDTWNANEQRWQTHQIVFEVTVAVLFTKSVWHSEKKKETPVFPVPLSSSVKSGKLIAYFIKSLSIMRQSKTENSKFHTSHLRVILFLGAQLIYL